MSEKKWHKFSDGHPLKEGIYWVWIDPKEDPPFGPYIITKSFCFNRGWQGDYDKTWTHWMRRIEPEAPSADNTV